MHIYFTFMMFLFGLVFASFLNALLYRIDNGYKYPDIFIRGSHCEKCGKLLKTYELIPVLSFLIFKGKCSICGYRIPLYYPISEFMLGIGMGSIYYFSLPPILYIVLLFFFCFSYYDRIYKGIPQSLVNVYLVLSVVYIFVTILLTHSIPENALLAGIGFSAFVMLIGKVMKKPFGIGDILVLLGLSLVLSLKLYIGYIYLFLIVTSLYSIALILIKRKQYKSRIALLPFMYICLSLLFVFNEYILELLSKVFYF